MSTIDPKFLDIEHDGVTYHFPVGGSLGDFSKTIDTPASVQSFADGTNWAMGIEAEIHPVQEGSGDPTPDEETWTQIAIPSTNYYHNGVTFVSDSSGGYTATGTGGSGNSYDNLYNWASISSTPFNSLKGKKVGIYGGSANVRFTLAFRDSSNTQIFEQNSFSNTVVRATIPNEAAKVYIGLRVLSGVYVNETIYPKIVSIETVPGNTRPITGWTGAEISLSPTQDPQDAETYNVSFPSSAGTVYCGKLKIRMDGTVEITATYAKVKLTGSMFTQDEISGTSARMYGVLTGMDSYSGTEDDDTMCDKIVQGETGDTSLPFSITIGDDDNYVYLNGFDKIDISSFSDAKLWVDNNNVSISYRLASPLVYQFTAEQIRSLIGQNYLSANCGDIDSVTYVCKEGIDFIHEDTTGQIRNATDPIKSELNGIESATVIVVDGNTAPKNISSGQYLFIKNHATLATGGYHATAAISSGASVTSNNVTADSNGVVNAILSKVNGVINDSATASDTTWSSNKINNSLAGKVNTESGKGLSTNDFTDAEKTKLDNMIDDTTGTGDTAQTWSADKLVSEFGGKMDDTPIATTTETQAIIDEYEVSA